MNKRVNSFLTLSRYYWGKKGFFLMERDFDTKGAPLIKTKFGLVSATKANFSLSWRQMVGNKDFEQSVGAETGVYCLLPDELIPF